MIHERLRRCVGQMLLAAMLCGAAVPAPSVAHAQPAAAEDLNAEQRSLIEQLTADKAMSVARERRLADEAQERLYAVLATKDRALRAAEVRAKGRAAELARLRRERDGITRQREQLIAALTDRDRTLEAEVRAYRETVTGLALSPDPRKQAALQRFADGEQAEALADLDLIADADRAARRKAADLAEAANRRPVARLAVEALDQGKVLLPEVVARFERLTRLDPGVTADWIQLASLYDTQGRLADARRAADAALKTVVAGADPQPRAATLTMLGLLAMKGGELGRAKALFEEALDTRRKLAKDNPTSAEAQRDVSFSLVKLGDVAVAAGDLGRAKVLFEESLVTTRKLAKDNPTSATAQCDLIISLFKLGRLRSDPRLLKESLVIVRTLDKEGRLRPADRFLLDVIPKAIEAIP